MCFFLSVVHVELCLHAGVSIRACIRICLLLYWCLGKVELHVMQFIILFNLVLVLFCDAQIHVKPCFQRHIFHQVTEYDLSKFQDVHDIIKNGSYGHGSGETIYIKDKTVYYYVGPSTPIVYAVSIYNFISRNKIFILRALV